MSEQTDNLKQIAQIRKAIAPLVNVLSRENDAKIEKRLETIETALAALLQKDVNVTVEPTPVSVTVDTTEITKLLKKSADVTPVKMPTTYEPHDQAKKGTLQYSGFVAEDGSWYIQRVAKGEQRYAKGNKDYSDAWADVSNLKYGYFDGN